MEEPICARNIGSPFGDGDLIWISILFILSQLLPGLVSIRVVTAEGGTPYPDAPDCDRPGHYVAGQSRERLSKANLTRLWIPRRLSLAQMLAR